MTIVAKIPENLERLRQGHGFLVGAVTGSERLEDVSDGHLLALESARVALAVHPARDGRRRIPERS